MSLFLTENLPYFPGAGEVGTVESASVTGENTFQVPGGLNHECNKNLLDRCFFSSFGGLYSNPSRNGD